MNDSRNPESTIGTQSPYSPVIRVTNDEFTGSVSLLHVFILSLAVSTLSSITVYLVALSIWLLHGSPDFYFRDFGFIGFGIGLLLCIVLAIGLAIVILPILYMLVRKGTDRHFAVRFLLISWSSCTALSVVKVLWEFERLRLFDSFGQIAFVTLLISAIFVVAVTARRAE